MKSIETIRSMERSEKIELRRFYAESIETLVTVYRSTEKPSDTIEKAVSELGYRPALLTVASLVNYLTNDGRIDRTVRMWAADIDDSLDAEAAYEMGAYTSSIHPAHMNQLGLAMMEYSPLDHFPGDGQPDDDRTDDGQLAGSEIAPDHITADGIEMATEWSVSASGRSAWAFTEIDGQRFKVGFTGDCGELFTAALAAAKRGETTQVDTDDLMTVLGTAVQLKPRAAKPAEINPDKQRRGEVPEKWFIGQSLEGPGWRILFDGDAGKTRVIFPRKPSAAILETVKAAGFYWSPALKSWNKGLTFRAFRAAEKLHAELHALTA